MGPVNTRTAKVAPRTQSDKLHSVKGFFRTTMDKDSEVNRREENLGTVWGELSRVVREIHRRLFHHGDEISARLLLGRLQHILSELPEDDTAIVREEGICVVPPPQG